MKRIIHFSQLFLVLILLTSCKTTNKDNPNMDSFDSIDESSNLEKTKIEIKSSCGEEDISKYLNDGWIILKEDSQKKICT